jgi:dUTP pyrophosphatase
MGEPQVKPGDRIAQLIITKIETPDMVEVGSLEALGDTVRGEGGYGSTGVAKAL